MMDMFSRLLPTPLAYTLGPCHCFQSRCPPAYPIAARATTFPSRMILPGNKLRLPFCQTSKIAEYAIIQAVKIGSRPGYAIATPIADFRDSVSSTKIRLSDLGFYPAIKRAKFLGAPTGAGSCITTSFTGRDALLTPSRHVEAPRRAVDTRISFAASVAGMKWLIAMFTVARFLASHNAIIALIDERYAEIAAERLAAARVLNFEPQASAEAVRMFD